MGEEMLLNQAMAYFGMESKTSQPTKNAFPENITNMTRFERPKIAGDIFTKYVRHHQYGKLISRPPMPVPPIEEEIQIMYKVIGTTPQGNLLVAPVKIPEPTPPAPDPSLIS